MSYNFDGLGRPSSLNSDSPFAIANHALHDTSHPGPPKTVTPRPRPPMQQQGPPRVVQYDGRGFTAAPPPKQQPPQGGYYPPPQQQGGYYQPPAPQARQSYPPPTGYQPPPPAQLHHANSYPQQQPPHQPYQQPPPPAQYNAPPPQQYTPPQPYQTPQLPGGYPNPPPQPHQSQPPPPPQQGQWDYRDQLPKSQPTRTSSHGPPPPPAQQQREYRPPHSAGSGSQQQQQGQGQQGQQRPRERPVSTAESRAVEEAELYKMFSAIDINSTGSLTARDVQKLLNIGQNGLRGGGGLGGVEGSEGCVKMDWHAIFQRFDTDASGTIDRRELGEALMSFGFGLPGDLVRRLEGRFAPPKQDGVPKGISFDRFLMACITVKFYTEAFRKRDIKNEGRLTLDYNTFMEMVIDSPS